MKIINNPDVNRYNVISKAVELNNGYCPCLVFKNQDTKCPCKEFREQNKIGLCRCGRYMKVEE